MTDETRTPEAADPAPTPSTDPTGKPEYSEGDPPIPAANAAAAEGDVRLELVPTADAIGRISALLVAEGRKLSEAMGRVQGDSEKILTFGENPADLPSWGKMKDAGLGLVDVWKDAFADKKLTGDEILRGVGHVTLLGSSMAKTIGAAESGSIKDWIEDVCVDAYHDKDLGIDFDIPVLFGFIETKVEDTVIRSIARQVAKWILGD